MLRGIRARLLGLVIATVVPFTALVGVGLWNQWRSDQAQAIRSALTEARLLAAQVDDQIGQFENLLVGLSAGLAADPVDIKKNDAILRETKAQLPDYMGSLLLSSPDGNNIGTWTNAQAGQNIAVETNATYTPILPSFGFLPTSVPIFSKCVMRSEGN